MRSSRTTALGMAGALAIGLLAACSSGGGDGNPTTGAAPTGAGPTSGAPEPITITVAGNLPGASQDNVDQLNARIKEFEAKYPYITVDAPDYLWTATTFTAQLAGGTLPDVIEIARSHKQDMTAAIAAVLPKSRQRAQIAQAVALAIDGAIVRAQFDPSPNAALAALRRIINALLKA